MAEHDGAAAALDALAERYWQFLRHEFPLSALLAGQPNDDPTMFRESPADVDRRAATAAALLAELDAIAPEALAPQPRITHGLLRRELSDLCEAHATGSHLRPWLLPVGPEFSTVFFANSVELPDADAARRYGARLATLPGYLADVQACLQRGLERGLRYPRPVLQAAHANLLALVSGPVEAMPWLGPFRRSPAAGSGALDAEARRARDEVEQRLLPALRAYAGFVQDRLLPAARDSIACTDDPGGAAYYAFWVRHFTTVPMEPMAIHALGLSEVERLEREVEAVAAQAGFAGDAAGYRRFLREDPRFRAPSADALREAVEVLAKRIDGRIPSLIGRLPRSSYGVQSIPPAAAEKLPLAYAQPNPADGSAAGQLWISSLPDRAPLYTLVSITLHEAWPGHLMHIALMQEMDELPAFRRGNFTKYTACLEGWAMYCESLGHELGLYETPHQHFGRLDMALWRACRLVVDTGLHVGGWSRAQAADYMAERLTLSRAAIEAEVDRYIAMPGQALAYLIGGLKFHELRERASARLGPAFQLRAFHDQLLAAGAVTLPVLEDTIDRWLQQHHAA